MGITGPVHAHRSAALYPLNSGRHPPPRLSWACASLRASASVELMESPAGAHQQRLRHFDAQRLPQIDGES